MTYITRDKTHADVFDRIEVFYNRTRRHSKSGMLSPVDSKRSKSVFLYRWNQWKSTNPCPGGPPRSTLLPMRLVADLHLHSHYSRATSPKLRPAQLERWARIKGI